MKLTPKERRELLEISEELLAATEKNAFWLGRARQTALEIQERIGHWLADEPDGDDGPQST